MKTEQHGRWFGGFLLAGCAVGAFALGQEGGKAPEKAAPEKERSKFVLPELPAPSDDQQEMIRLFYEVERALGAIDVELADASAGRIPVPEGGDGGIDRLLRSHGEKSEQAVSGIEKILEVAQRMGSQSCSSCMRPGQSQTKPDGQSPLDKERQRGPSEAERTPEAPKPDPEGEQNEKKEPQPSQQPDGDAKNPLSGENRPSAPRLDPSGPAVAPGADAERWGVLPVRVQQVFQNQITDDLPLQYRDWIDAYYRRLNKSR